MSNQAPTSSFGGPSKYSQQWPGSNPSSSSMPSSLPHSLPFNQNQMPNSQQLQDGLRYPFDYNEVNLSANSRLPGLGAPVPAAGSLPPPPFPFMGNFAPSHFFPPPFPPMQMPPMRYPPMPVPPASINTPPSRPLTSDLQSLSNFGPVTNAEPQLETSTISKQDMDREEGELTDMEGALSHQGTEPPHDMSLSSSGRRPQRSTNFQTGHLVNGERARTKNIKETDSHAYVPKDSRCVSSGVEEGEASSPSSRSSSRDSGSPYNPPISVSAEPYISGDRINDEAVTPKLLSQCLSVKSKFPAPPTELQTISNSGKSPAQLRVQAQGALLSLAPHNIRFSELVGEGINPVILKQLYEEVGIKVPTPQPDSASTLVSAPSSTAHNRPVTNHTASMDNVREQEREERQAVEAVRVENVAQSSGLAEAALPPSSQLGTAKPMERKEVIARMLAAKAAKSAGAPASPQTDVTKEAPSSCSSPTTDVDKPTDAVSSTESLVQDKEGRVREKSKAQTELARQRIEQLKKQGLMRTQQKSVSDTMPLSKVHENTKSVQGSGPNSNSSSIQHPLPERPPDPEIGAFARIPGLFMAEVQQISPDEPSMTPTPGLVVDATPQPRFNQRKRPRASDFDEPVPMPKKALNNGVNNTVSADRLIIDISDDDLYEDDENDDMDVERLADNTLQSSFPDGQQRTCLVAESLPPRPVTASSQGFSLSATPQNSRNYSQEDLRKKDLEIQAIHKRIAELEQRKKAKLAASRTQSPRVLDSSESTPPEGSTPTDTPERDSSQADTMNNLSKATIQTRSPSITQMDLPRYLDSLNAEQLENMKSKVLRKQEIESGVPALDEEIRKSETRLADFNFEQEKLLLEITRGKEGRKQLLEELGNLSTELSGVSLEDVESALVRLKNKEQELANEALTLQPNTTDGDVIRTLDASGAKLQPQDTKDPALKPSLEPPAKPVAQSHLSDIAVKQRDVSGASRESTPTSSSDSSGSAMDESSDSDSDSDSDDDSNSSDSADEGESKAPSPASDVHMSEMGDETEETNQVEACRLSGEHCQSTNTEIQTDMSLSSGEQPIELTEDQASDKSTVSEAYEPPEPEANASPADSAYTPPFSPASPGAIEHTEPRFPVQKSENTGEPPMGHVQDTGVAQSGEDTQVGLLDNTRQPGNSDHKFSPYVSPLKFFKAYRYHPNYTDEVTGGYRSLTYSHNIDPMVYLCPFEGAGGVCNDRSCEFQHFRDMTLSDDKILVQMGSLREGKTPEEKDSYIAGLKNIINDMRRDKVKDFSTVATEIAAYRRRFLQDPSRVLPL